MQRTAFRIEASRLDGHLAGRCSVTLVRFLLFWLASVVGLACGDRVLTEGDPITAGVSPRRDASAPPQRFDFGPFAQSNEPSSGPPVAQSREARVVAPTSVPAWLHRTQVAGPVYAADAPNCISGESNCEGLCADLALDRHNCGACGAACAADEECRAGSCAPSGDSPSPFSPHSRRRCSPGFEACGDACVDVRTSPSNCGVCGVTCSNYQSCRRGTCGS